MSRRKDFSFFTFNHRHHASTLLAFLLLIAFSPSCDAYIFGQSRRMETETARGVEVINKSGRRLELFWVNMQNPRQEDFVSQTENGDGIAYGASTGINSFVGHTFELRELPGKNSGNCLQEECWKGRFTVSSEFEQEVLIEKGFILDHSSGYQRSIKTARTLYEECEEKVKFEAVGEDLDTLETIDAISDCMTQKTDAKLEEQQEEVDFQVQLRAKMAENIAPLACGDVNYTVSEEGKNVSWAYTSRNQNNGRRRGETFYKLRILHQRKSSFIASVHGFATLAECSALKHFEESLPDGSLSFASMDKFRAAPQKYGSSLLQLTDKLTSLAGEYLDWPDLDVSTLSNRDGRLFEVHKDPSGGMTVPALLCTADDLEIEKETGVRDCKLPGEGPVLVSTTHLQVDPPGEVDGSYSKVATAFVFCEDPINKQLGALHFPDAGVHIAPKRGMLVFAIHRQRGETDLDGYVQDYHLCPNHQLYTQSFYDKVTVTEES